MEENDATCYPTKQIPLPDNRERDQRSTHFKDLVKTISELLLGGIVNAYLQQMM